MTDFHNTFSNVLEKTIKTAELNGYNPTPTDFKPVLNYIKKYCSCLYSIITPGCAVSKTLDLMNPPNNLFMDIDYSFKQFYKDQLPMNYQQAFNEFKTAIWNELEVQFFKKIHIIMCKGTYYIRHDNINYGNMTDTLKVVMYPKNGDEFITYDFANYLEMAKVSF